MKKYNNCVDDHIKEKIEQLQDSNNKLKTLNYMISHEIKSPLHAIDCYAKIFIEDYENQVNKEGIELIKNIRNISNETVLLVNRLLEYIKFSDKKQTKEIIDLEKLIKSTFNELAIPCIYNEKKQLKFESKLPNIRGDRILIKQVIANIISNSLKFTRNKESAIITVGYYFENNENVFYIKDNGIGFDMKFSKNIFELFTRMHSESEFEGSGVGLAIVRKIIKDLGGLVWITGEVNKGASVYFTIDRENILK